MGRRREYFLKGVQEGQIPLPEPRPRDPDQLQARLSKAVGRPVTNHEMTVLTARILREMSNAEPDEIGQVRLERFLAVYSDD